MKEKKPRSIEGFTTLDKFLDEEGKREEFQAVAIKEVLAWQIAEAMKAQGLSRKRLAERAKEADGSLPAIARDVWRPHRRRSVLQDDEIDARRSQDRNFRRRPRQREDRQRARHDECEPEHQAAENRKALAHRQPPVLPEPPRIAPPPANLPDPHHEQHARRDQEPEVSRLRESDAVEIDASQH